MSIEGILPDSIPTAEKDPIQEDLGLKIIEEINSLQQGRKLEDLDVKELKAVKEKYLSLRQVLGITPAETAEREGVDYERAQEIMGESFYGKKEIENAFGFEVKDSEIPPIPYSPEELEQARELGESLVLRISKDAEGQPMTMKRINEIMNGRMSDEEGALLFDTDWYENEDFYESTPLTAEWRLVGGAFVPDVSSSKDKEGKYEKDSRGNNYVHQTRLLREYLKSTGSLNEEDEVACSDEVLRELSEEMGIDWNTQDLVDSNKYNANWKTVAKKLSELPINQKHRRTPTEIIYDWSLKFKQSGDREIIEHDYDWSNSVSSDGGLVIVGRAGSDGARVDGWGPGSRDGGVGVGSLR